MKGLKLKVCGLRQTKNIRQLLDLQPDYIGFIFYKKSKRFVEGIKSSDALKAFDDRTIEARKTGVFVNESIENITTYVEKYNLDTLQLHGEETPVFCKKLKHLNLEIIKVFSVGNDFDFAPKESLCEKTKPYEGIVDKFLFDTKGKLPGGNGFVFNWEILKNYEGKTPFFLSGGIGIDSVEAIKKFKHPMLFGLDVNSKFEIEPGLKDVELVKKFKTQLAQGSALCE